MSELEVGSLKTAHFLPFATFTLFLPGLPAFQPVCRFNETVVNQTKVKTSYPKSPVGY